MFLQRMGWLMIDPMATSRLRRVNMKALILIASAGLLSSGAIAQSTMNSGQTTGAVTHDVKTTSVRHTGSVTHNKTTMHRHRHHHAMRHHHHAMKPIHHSMSTMHKKVTVQTKTSG